MGFITLFICINLFLDFIMIYMIAYNGIPLGKKFKTKPCRDQLITNPPNGETL